MDVTHSWTLIQAGIRSFALFEKSKAQPKNKQTHTKKKVHGKTGAKFIPIH